MEKIPGGSDVQDKRNFLHIHLSLEVLFPFFQVVFGEERRGGIKFRSRSSKHVLLLFNIVANIFLGWFAISIKGHSYSMVKVTIFGIGEESIEIFPGFFFMVLTCSIFLIESLLSSPF